MGNLVIKKKIAKNFSLAANRYDELAKIQQRIVAEGLQRFAHNKGRCLDIGCGTASYHVDLASRVDELIGVDISPGMLTQARLNRQPNRALVCADAEQLPFTANTFDSVFSCMALQWCEQLDELFAEIYRVLKPGGRGLIAVMVQGSFSQWDHCWPDDTCRHRQFLSLQSWQQAGQQAGFHTAGEINQFTDWHSDIKAMMQSIKGIGAGTVTDNQPPLSRAALAQFVSRYRTLQNTQGQYPLDYHIGFLTLTK